MKTYSISARARDRLGFFSLFLVSSCSFVLVTALVVFAMTGNGYEIRAGRRLVRFIVYNIFRSGKLVNVCLCSCDLLD